jgi:hypothetical protein
MPGSIAPASRPPSISETTAMHDLFQSVTNLPTPFNMIVLVVLISCAAGVITSIAKQIRKYGSHRQELDFKRELVERGMSVDEIERIIAATGPATSGGQGKFVADD